MARRGSVRRGALTGARRGGAAPGLVPSRCTTCSGARGSSRSPPPTSTPPRPALRPRPASGRRPAARGRDGMRAWRRQDLRRWKPLKEFSPAERWKGGVLAPRPELFDSELVEPGPPAALIGEYIVLLYNGAPAAPAAPPAPRMCRRRARRLLRRRGRGRAGRRQERALRQGRDPRAVYGRLLGGAGGDVRGGPHQGAAPRGRAALGARSALRDRGPGLPAPRPAPPRPARRAPHGARRGR